MATTTWQDGLRRLLRRVDATGETVTDGFPHYGDPATGRWTTSPGGDWTGGFWNGMCWLAAHGTGQARYRRWAQQWTERLRPRAHSDTVFRGFLFYYGALLGSALLADPLAREVALEGGQGLAASFNPKAGVLPLGNEAEEASDVGRGESSIDGVQGAALLVWAAQESGDPSLREMAVSHARRHIEFCIRADGSVCQSASFDRETGHVIRRYTHKGVRDDSTWTRAQAWAMVGYALMHCWTREPEFLDVATRTADWWLAHAPTDRVAFWDFDAPAAPETNRDTSGTAIAGAALLKLAALAPNETPAGAVPGRRRGHGERAGRTLPRRAGDPLPRLLQQADQPRDPERADLGLVLPLRGPPRPQRGPPPGPDLRIGATVERRSPMKRLDRGEQELLRAYEKGKLVSARPTKSKLRALRDAARATFIKSRRVNIRLSASDLMDIQARAYEEGVPYQTLIASVLHKYVSGRLREARLRRTTRSTPARGGWRRRSQQKLGL